MSLSEQFLAQASDGLAMITVTSRRNSERWFPALHTNNPELSVFYTLGMVGEAGEVANKVKKSLRGIGDVTHAEMVSELADVFTYLLLLAGELEIDLVQAWWLKQKVCEDRWGSPVQPVEHVHHA